MNLKRLILIVLIAVAFFAICFTVFLEIKLKDVRSELSELTARNAAASAILNGVEETIQKAGYYYSDLVEIVRDEEGNIKSLVTNTAGLNTVSNAVNRNVDNRISEMKTYPVSVPITTVMGGELISGIGPKIKFYVTLTGTASTGFENEFSSAGVNQTLHRIMLKITVKTYVVFGKSVSKYTVTNTVCIAENVIVGITPNAVAQLTGEK